MLVRDNIAEKEQSNSLRWWLTQYGDPVGQLPTRSWGYHRVRKPGSCAGASAYKVCMSLDEECSGYVLCPLVMSDWFALM